MVKNLPSSLGEVGLMPGQGTKTPHAKGCLRLPNAATEPMHSRDCAREGLKLQLERKPVL